MMKIFATLGTQVPSPRKDFLVALKRCASGGLQAAVQFHLSQRTRKMGHPAVVFVLAFCCCVGLQAAGQAAGVTVPGPKADAIYIHANVYTGVPSNAGFSSIL